MFNENWEKLWVSFMIYHAEEELYDECLFTCEKINTRMQRMEPMRTPHEWMLPKYGTKVRPWQVALEFPNTESEEGQFRGGADSNLKYRYTLRNSQTGDMVSERDERWIDLQNPNEYTGQLGQQRSCLWLNTDRCWLVNGAVFKADGNFLNHFFFRTIGDTPITVGSYPQTQSDYERLNNHGTTAVLNLMDEADLRQHQLDQTEQA